MGFPLWACKLPIPWGRPCFPQHLQVSLSLYYSHGEYIQCIHGAPHHLEVVLENGDGARQRLMSAAAEQSHARVQQDGGYEGWVRNPTQAFDATFKAS